MKKLTKSGMVKKSFNWQQIGIFFILSIMLGMQANAQTTLINSDLEPGDPTGWVFANSAGVNKWTIGTATNNGGTQGIYVSSDLGVSNAYNITTVTYSHFYTSVSFPGGETAVILKFDWKGIGEQSTTNYDYFRVSLSAANPVNTAMPALADQLPIIFNSQAGYTTAYIAIPASMATGTKNLIFSWYNDGSLTNGPPAAIDNISLVSNIPSPLTGTLSIPGSYNGMSEAIANLNAHGVGGGGVMFDVMAGSVFTETPSAITATGTPSDPIVFQKSGVGSNPLIVSSGTGNFGATTNTTTTSIGDGIIVIAGGDYITFDGIDVQSANIVGATTTTNVIEYGYLIKNASATNGAQNIVVKNTNITLNRVNANSRGILQSASAIGGGIIPTAATGANSFNKYLNLNIKNTYYGLYLLGNATFPDIACEIGTDVCTNFNTIGDPTTPHDIGGATATTVAYGIRAGSQQDVKIYNNKVSNVSGTGINDGIFLELFQGACEVYNNIVKSVRNVGTTSTSIISGIGLSHRTTLTHSVRVYNNVVSDITSAYTGAATATRIIRGINVRGTSGLTTSFYEIYNNSVSINGVGSLNCSSSCFDIATTSGPQYIVRNNIFANFTPAQTGVARHYCVTSTSATIYGPAGTDLENNDYYLANDAGVSGFLGLGGTTTYLNLGAWQAGITTPNPHDIGSLEIDPLFTNPTSDLHISATALNGTAGPYPGAGYLMNDVECNPRGDFDFGAYNLESCSAATGGSVSPTTVAICSNFSHTMTATGTSTGAGIVYQWEVSNTSGSGFVPVSSGTGANSTVYNTGLLTPGIYYFRLNVTCNGSITDYSNEVELTINELPSVSVSVTSTTICQPGASATNIIADGANTYAWLPVTGLDVSTGASVNATPTGSLTYTVTGTDVNGCTGTALSTITVNLKPALSEATATPQNLCIGGSSQLNVSAACVTTALKITEVTAFRTGSGVTNPYPSFLTTPVAVADMVEVSNISSAPVDVSGLVFELWSGATTNRTYTFLPGTIINGNSMIVLGLQTGTNDPINGLYYTGGTTDFIQSAGIVGLVIKQGATIIDAVALNSYVWPVASLVSASDWSGNIPSSSARAGVIRSASTDGNSAADWVVSNTGGPIQTMGTYNPGYAAVSCTNSYLWSPTTFMNSGDETLSNPMVNGVSVTTIYTVTATNAAGCSDSRTVTVSVEPLTVVASASPSTICAGDSAEVNAVVSGGGAPYTYSWFDGLSIVATTSLDSLKPLVTTTYTLTVSDVCSNVVTTTVTLAVNTTPSLSGTNSIQCGAGIPTASVTSTAGGAGTGSIFWYSAPTGGTLLQGPPYNGPMFTTYSNDFNAPGLGSAIILGNASVTANQLQLHPNAASQYGSLTVDASNINSSSYMVDFDLTTFRDALATEMADGLSYSFGNDVVSAAEGSMNAENGTGTKLKLAFVAYGTGLQGIYLMYNSTVNEQTPTSPGVLAHSTNLSWMNTANNHVTLSINSLGQASLTLAGNPIFTNVQLPAAFLAANKASWKHVFKGRAGGITMGTQLDNIVIQQAAASAGTTTYLNSVASTTTFYVSELGTNGCQSLRTPVTVTVNPPDVITINPTTVSRCPTDAGNSLTASSVNTNYTYTWAPATALDVTSGATVLASPTATTTYTVTGTDPIQGCVTTATVVVTVIAPPSGVTASSNSPVCEGANLALNSANTAPPYFLNPNCNTGFIDISATGTSVPGIVGDDVEHNISMPAFTFNGVTYTNARVGNNGVIALGSTTGEIGFTNATLPTTANSAGNILLLPYWDDLDTFLAPQPLPTIKTETVGSLFIIQYTNESHNAFKTGTGITFQVQLDLVGGNITYVYDDVIFGSTTVDSGASATIGIQMSSTSALQFSFNTKSLFNGKCVSFSPYSSTLTYDWSGPNGSIATTKNTNISNVPLTAAGMYTVTVTSPITGCYSTATTNVVVNPKYQTAISHTACDSYTWPANTTTYTVGGIYSATLLSVAGCDSVVTLTLTINNSTASAVSVSSNGCYTWPLNNTLYASSGAYSTTLVGANAVGCDSVVTLNLTVLSGLQVRAKAMLSGAYDESTLLMRDDLRALGQIPLADPYEFAPYNKPFGGEVITNPAILAANGNNSIVDWMYLELRSASTPATVVAIKRALIQRDGDIVSHEDGVSPVFFAGMPAGNYFVTVKHRNHLGVMTDVAVALTSCASSVLDFTTGSVWVKPGELNAPRRVQGGVATMWSSDAATNKNAKYNGVANDKQAVLNALGGAFNAVSLPSYRAEDVNMDGVVKYNNTNNDRNIIANTVGVQTPNNIVNQHTPN